MYNVGCIDTALRRNAGTDRAQAVVPLLSISPQNRVESSQTAAIHATSLDVYIYIYICVCVCVCFQVFRSIIARTDGELCSVRE